MRENEVQHPYDTPASTAFRFASEVIAWTGAAWFVGQSSALLAALGVVILIGLPTVFTTPGDKKHNLVTTPGPIRILIDLLHYAVAMIVPWLIWPNWLAAVCVLCAAGSFALGLPRLRWLLSGAPPMNH